MGVGARQQAIIGWAREWLAPGLLLGGLSLLLAWVLGGLSPSFIDPDESAHYVNALFIGDWLRVGLPSPLPFAEAYYQHYPKLSIGHWPPGWYGLLSPIFALFRPSPLTALALSAFVAGLPALLVLRVLRRLGHPRLGLLAAGLYLLLPLVLEAGRHFLLDQPVTLLFGLGVLAWAAAVERTSLPRFLLFAGLVAAAALTKGNGLALALVPLFDILLGRRWALLRDLRLWAAGLVAILLIAPWYWISTRISAGGFNYEAGPAYAWEALRANLEALDANIPLGTVALAAAFLMRPHGDARARRMARLCLSVLLAVLAFQSLVPVALAPRYMNPVLPWATILVALAVGRGWAAARDFRGEYRPMPQLAAALLLALAIGVGAVRAAQLTPKTDAGAPALAGAMAARPGIWLADGRAGGEGAVIAAAAHRDEARRIWVVRSSQWLSESDFMGRGYRLIARTPDEVRAVLDRLGATGVVIVAERDRFAYPHSALLARAVQDQGWRLERRSFTTGQGFVLVATRRAPIRPNFDALTNRSANAAKLKGALD